ncbi:hypothetical protein ABDB91_08480 [Desulfoscipio sp. XC116]|uniref:hypothetical protein n=1 Tax=Desulfoscipio sp. XC116 TaxID=3144975 RepID=UPI00325AE985
MKISDIIAQLDNLGIKVYIGRQGEARLKVPELVPDGARSLLTELRQRKTEAVEYLRWDETQAMALLAQSLGRINHRYIAGALPWAAEHSPELYQVLKPAERRFNDAYRARSISDCRQAVMEYETAFNALIAEFQRSDAG